MLLFLVLKLIGHVYLTKPMFYTITSHENDADRARRARAFCLIRTVPRRQYIAFSISVLDEWEWMAKRLAILENIDAIIDSYGRKYPRSN